MAVQKSRKSKSKKKIRRSANSVFNLPVLSADKETGETHLRFFVTKTGYYKGKQVFQKTNKKEKKKKELTENSNIK